MEEKNRWKLLLEKLDMNQTQLADKVGVNKSHISKLVSGQTNASERLLFAVEKKCGVSRLWIKTGEEPMFLVESDARRRVLGLAEGLNDEQARAVSAFIRLLHEEE